MFEKNVFGGLHTLDQRSKDNHSIEHNLPLASFTKSASYRISCLHRLSLSIKLVSETRIAIFHILRHVRRTVTRDMLKIILAQVEIS